jgi:hypothetical protein
MREEDNPRSSPRATPRGDGEGMNRDVIVGDGEYASFKEKELL